MRYLIFSFAALFLTACADPDNPVGYIAPAGKAVVDEKDEEVKQPPAPNFRSDVEIPPPSQSSEPPGLDGSSEPPGLDGSSEPPGLDGSNLVQASRCGGKRAPNLSGSDLLAGYIYLCNTTTDEWVKNRKAIPGIDYATDDQLEWYPTSPCDRQKYARDPLRDLFLIYRNENFSQSECDNWVAEQLATECQKRSGSNTPYCYLIPSGRALDKSAYGRVFLMTPQQNGTCSYTSIFWGSYDDAVDFEATDSRCNQ